MNTRRYTLLALLAAGCWVSHAFAQPGDIDTDRVPELRVPAPSNSPPPVDELEQAQERISRLLKTRIDVEADDSAAIAHQILELALGTDDDAAAQFVLFQTAVKFAQKAVDLQLTEQMIDAAAQRYRVDSAQWKADSFKAILAHQIDEPIQAGVQLNRVIELVEDALMVDRIELAEELMNLASGIANRSARQDLIEQVAQWNDLANEWSTNAMKARHAALRLHQDPSDVDANLALGRYLCFIKGNWKRGLPLLAQCGDESIREVAEADFKLQDDQNRIAVADGWFKLAGSHKGLVKQRMILRADEIYRGAYSAVTGLTRLQIEEQMISQPLFVFDSSNPPSEHWLEEKLNFRGNYGREGIGSWANLMIEDGQAILVANRAGYVQTLDQFPPQDAEHYQIDAILWSDLLKGTALEFGGQRMYFGRKDGIHLEGGWVPNVIFPITNGKYYHYLIDVSPDGISFTVDGVYLGTMETDTLASGGIVLRGWEGHVRCRRLVVWAVPDPTLPIQLNQDHPESGEAPKAEPEG